MPKVSKDCFNESFACMWTWDDLKRINPKLTDEQCRKVIQRLYDEWNCRIGLNEDMVEMMIDSVLYWEAQEKVGIHRC